MMTRPRWIYHPAAYSCSIFTGSLLVATASCLVWAYSVQLLPSINAATATVPFGLSACGFVACRCRHLMARLAAAIEPPPDREAILAAVPCDARLHQPPLYGDNSPGAKAPPIMIDHRLL